jgi:hypothetical protein
MVRHLGRRGFLGAAFAGAARADAAPAGGEKIPAEEVRAGSSGFDRHDLRLDGAPDLSRRAWIFAPRDLDARAPAGVLLLWHGLGETGNERAGVGAWAERYGLLTCFDRLAHPPVTASSKRGDLADDRAREISRQLEERPFAGRFILVCPYTPNIWKLKSVPKGLDQLAGWVGETLLPAVSARMARTVEPARTAMDGCSLGGLVSFEIFVRRPELFAACGGVQAALNEGQVPTLASRLQASLAGRRRPADARLHIETSRNDPFRASNLALSRELRRAGVAHDVSVLPGPHDQPWLREAGTLEMLLWHDRSLAMTENPK